MSKSKNPFLRDIEETKKKRLKLLLWGDTGSGKTTLALKFPNPCVLCFDRGAEPYMENNIIFVNTLDDIPQAIEYLKRERHDYLTLIIDDISVYWEMIMSKWSALMFKYNKKSSGFKNEYYAFQPNDWMSIKAEFKEFIRALLILDMNIVVTAREKTNYRDGAFMQVDGKTFDCEKSLAYAFDTVVQLYVNRKGDYLSTRIKDRNKQLPLEFETDYAIYEKSFKDILTRKMEMVDYCNDSQRVKIIELLRDLEADPDDVRSNLRSNYGVDKVADLTSEQADKIIDRLTAKVKAKGGDTDGEN